MIDASIAFDLIARFRPEPIEKLLWAPDTRMAAPDLLDVEVLHTLHRHPGEQLERRVAS